MLSKKIQSSSMKRLINIRKQEGYLPEGPNGHSPFMKHLLVGDRVQSEVDRNIYFEIWFSVFIQIRTCTFMLIILMT